MAKLLAELVLEMIDLYRGNDLPVEILITIAACSWNMTIIPHNEAEELRKSILLTSIEDKHKQLLQELIDKFTQYKLENYKDDKRLIFEFQFDKDSEPPSLDITTMYQGFRDSE